MGVPNGWTDTTLTSIARVRTGGTPSRADPQNWTGGTIPWVTTSEVQGGRIHETAQHITNAGLKGSSAKVVPAGSILVAMVGQGKTRGQSSILEIDAATSQNSAALIPTDAVLAGFLHQYLVFSYSALRSLSNSSGLGNLNAGLIGRLAVALPPIREQRKIAEILRTWDDAIELSLSLRQRFLDRRDWLRRFVLTGRDRLALHHAAWTTATLGGFLSEHRSKSSGREEVYSVSVHKGLVNQVEHLGRSFAGATTSHYNLVRPGDIVYTKSPTGDFPLGIVKQSTGKRDVIVSPLYGVFSPVTTALGTILSMCFESPIYASNYLSPLVQKGAKNTISITNRRFLEGEVTLPSDPAEQSAIASLIDASTKEIATLDRKIELLRTQKRGLMQKLLTGEVRVKIDEDTKND